MKCSFFSLLAILIGTSVLFSCSNEEEDQMPGKLQEDF